MRTRMLLYFSLFTLHYSLCTAQTWEPVGGGITWPDSLYKESHAEEVLPYNVYTLYVYNGKLYAGGRFTKVGNMNTSGIACWNGRKWSSLGTGVDGLVFAMGTWNNTLVAGGAFNRVNGKHAENIARWIDTTNTVPSWYYYRSGLARTYVSSGYDKQYIGEGVTAIKEYKGELYAGVCMGGFYKWDPEKKFWTQVNLIVSDSLNPDTRAPATLKLASMDVTGLIEFNKQLYITGEFVDPAYKYESQVLVWNGTALQKTRLPNFPKEIFSINCTVSSDSGLYFGVRDTGRGGNAIVRLNNDGTWKTIYRFPTNSYVNAMVVYNNKLYVGGYLNSVDGKIAHNIVCWDGKKWSTVGEGLSGKGKSKGIVQALCVYQGYLYAVGSFDHSGNKPIESLARWKLTSETHHTGR